MPFRIVNGFDNTDMLQFKQFIDSEHEAGVFQTREMYKAFSCDPHFQPGIVVCLDGEDIVGSLLWFVRTEYSGLLRTLTARSVVYGGPIIWGRRAEVLSLLLEAYIKIVSKEVVYSEFRNLFDLSWAWPEFAKLGFAREPHMNFLIDLTKSEEDLMNSMSQSRRKMLRKVIRKGDLIVKEVNSPRDIAIFYELIGMTYKKVKKPYPNLNHFLGSKEIMGDSAVCFLCYKDEVPVASRFLFCRKGLVYDWYAGSDPAYNADNPNEFLVWEILRWAKEKGYSTFDFGGGGNPEKPYGPREFKRRFGGEEAFFDRYLLVHKPLLMKLATTGFSIKQKTGLF